MSETTVATYAVQRAIFTALNTHLTDPITSNVVPVVDQTALTEDFPYVQFGPMIETAWNTMGRTGRQVLAQLDVWTRTGPDGASDGWGQARSIAGQIDVRLDGSLPAASDGWNFSGVMFEQSKDGIPTDAVTRRIVLEYRFWVEVTTP